MVTCEATLRDDATGVVIEIAAEAADEGTTFTISLIEGTADINGLFVDVGDDGGPISFVGSPANNMRGESNDGVTLDGFDFAEALGSVGGADDDFTSGTVTIAGLDIEDVDGAQIGIRATSVGEEEELSLKLVAIAECDDDDGGDGPVFTVDQAVSNLVAYVKCPESSEIQKIKFDNFDQLDCDEDGVIAAGGDDDDELFAISLSQIEEALGANGFGACDVWGVTIKAGNNDGGFGPGEGEFFNVDGGAEDTLTTGTGAGFDATIEATANADIWCG